MSFDEWLQTGIEQGWCAEPVCSTHDLVTMTSEEAEAFEEGGDPCVPVVRLWGER